METRTVNPYPDQFPPYFCAIQVQFPFSPNPVGHILFTTAFKNGDIEAIISFLVDELRHVCTSAVTMRYERMVIAEKLDVLKELYKGLYEHTIRFHIYVHSGSDEDRPKGPVTQWTTELRLSHWIAPDDPKRALLPNDVMIATGNARWGEALSAFAPV